MSVHCHLCPQRNFSPARSSLHEKPFSNIFAKSDQFAPDTHPPTHTHSPFFWDGRRGTEVREGLSLSESRAHVRRAAYPSPGQPPAQVRGAWLSLGRAAEKQHLQAAGCWVLPGKGSSSTEEGPVSKAKDPPVRAPLPPPSCYPSVPPHVARFQGLLLPCSLKVPAHNDTPRMPLTSGHWRGSWGSRELG